MFPARCTDSLQDLFIELILAFSGRPAGRPVSAPLRERAAPPQGFSPARGRASPLRATGPLKAMVLDLLSVGDLHRVAGIILY